MVDIMMRIIGAVGLLTFTFYQCLKLIHSLVRKKHVAQQIGLLDLPLLGKPRTDGKKIHGTAVVCGGSLAGLLSARILHDHFERVIIVEPEGWLTTEDAWPDSASQLKKRRTRLLQWEVYQTLQVWSASCFSKLFPNLASECALSHISITPADWKIHLSGFPVTPPFSEYNGNLPHVLCAGRPGLETLVRRLVIGRKNYLGIEQIHGTVTGLEKDPKNPQWISKVQIRHGGDNKVDSIPATLVVDCTGHSSPGVKMLQRLGYGTSLDVLAVQYNPDLHYTTYEMQVTDDMIQRFPVEARKPGPIHYGFPDWVMDRRLVMMQRIEGNTVQLLAGCWGRKNELPNSLDEFVQFSRSLNFAKPVPEWFLEVVNLLKEVEDKMHVKIAGIPRTVYTPFHLAGNMPSNWVAVGDSAMSLNPIFAQGISKLFLGIVSLNTMLHQVKLGQQLPSDFAKTFFEIQAAKIEPIWGGMKGIDYNFDTTTPAAGETLSTDGFVRAYVRSFHRLATQNRHASSTMWHVMNFLAPPIDCFHPYLVPRVFWLMFKEWLHG